MDGIAKALGIDAKDPQAWKTVHHKDVASRGGRGLLKRYRGSLFEALRDIYPAFRELQLRDLRQEMPRNYWHDRSASRDFLDRAAHSLGVGSRADWQKVSSRQVQALPGGHSLLRRYNGSLYAALRDVYGEEWAAATGAEEIYGCRSRVPRNYWNEEEHIREFVERLRKECSVQSKEDWYRVSRRQFEELNGGGLIQKYPLGKLLHIAYPKETWDVARLSSSLGKRSAQRLLATAAAQLLAGCEPVQSHELTEIV